ncbi:SDR family oxidoreductase [Alicyclobacillus fastidiosus]|uniref:SDR family oxidoreductase n=1 Tax=Alicyclobacillus fastidiosus TaxID=392011 RepID=A0ABY6ZQ86_9BACL|nr:SDR family oxidoreductase [Alicyclobacillus fastidiosus]WAH44120.1 SDR family oxidoreductase [Alicyclobacillus fastidiosus]
MQYPFAGKVALVTGGASGIGKAIAKRFVENGASVVIADLSVDAMADTEWKRAGASSQFVRVDVRREADLLDAVRFAKTTFGGLDILVNSAGIFPRATIQNTTAELWDKIMEVNLKGVYHACRAAIPEIIERGGGAIINIGSLNAFGGTPDLFAYSTSKGGIVTLTVNLARSLAKHKIRVNCVHPGWVLTEGEKEVQKQVGRPNNWYETEGEKLPLGRIQTPEDIAPCVLFLASDDASQITGQSLAVDGGLGFHY